MHIRLKPMIVALAFALTVNSHLACAADTATPGGTKADDDPAITEMSPIQVRAISPEKSYTAPVANTATKMDVPVRDIPVSIQTFKHELIQDEAGLGRVNDLGRNVSGVFIQEPGEGGSNTASFVFRGFNSGYWQLVDGSPHSAALTSPDLSNIERVEFLKGPASVLYGNLSGSYGGVVNFITKKPTVAPITEVEITAGSYDFYRATLDENRPLNLDKTVLLRVNAAEEKGGSFRDGIKHDTQSVAPTLSWNIDPNNSFLLQLEHKRAFYVNDWGWPVNSFVLS